MPTTDCIIIKYGSVEDAKYCSDFYMATLEPNSNKSDFSCHQFFSATNFFYATCELYCCEEGHLTTLYNVSRLSSVHCTQCTVQCTCFIMSTTVLTIRHKWAPQDFSRDISAKPNINVWGFSCYVLLHKVFGCQTLTLAVQDENSLYSFAFPSVCVGVLCTFVVVSG
jgi:hypothetical protein